MDAESEIIVVQSVKMGNEADKTHLADVVTRGRGNLAFCLKNEIASVVSLPRNDNCLFH